MHAIPLITGSTAVGKTELSVSLSVLLKSEIISADSRQVYRELTIGVAKPDRDVLRRIPHHFINERSLEEPFSAGMFMSEALDRIADILGRGRIPLVTGGSTLYLRALQYGLADIPDIPPSVRAHIRRRLDQEGPEALYEVLQQVDPRAAATMDPTKTQRLARALEVYEATGIPVSRFHETQAPPPYAFRTIVLQRNREELYARIERRVDEMLAAGLVDEVRGILEAGYLADIPDIPPSVRAHIRKRLDQEGPEALYEALQQVDPRAAATMDPTKTQRLARALEVYEATGIPLSRFHETQAPPPYAFRTIVLQRNREELYARIERRVDEMLAAGLVDEVRGLLEAGYDPGLNPLRTIGYREPIAFLKGEITEDEMVRLIKQNTRRYAKRQETWFRGDPGAIFMDAAQDSQSLLDAVRDVLGF